MHLLSLTSCLVSLFPITPTCHSHSPPTLTGNQSLLLNDYIFVCMYSYKMFIISSEGPFNFSKWC